MAENTSVMRATGNPSQACTGSHRKPGAGPSSADVHAARCWQKRLNKRPLRIRNVGFVSRRPARIMLLSGFKYPRHGKLSIYSVVAWMDIPCLEATRYFPFKL